MQKKEASIIKKIFSQYVLLIIVLLAYLFVFFIDRTIFDQALYRVWQIFKEVIPTLVVVFVLFSFSNYLFASKKFFKYFKKNNYIKWIVVVVGGIISSGPIYMWYPLMSDLRGKFLNNGMVACFLYNRAIKVPLLPMMVIYFGTKYVIVLFVTMVIASILQGYMINKLIKEV